VEVDARSLVLEEAGLRRNHLQIVGEPTTILNRRDVDRLLRSDDGAIDDVCLLRQDAQVGQRIFHLLESGEDGLAIVRDRGVVRRF